VRKERGTGGETKRQWEGRRVTTAEHCALVRNDQGGLEPRRFRTAGDAATISLDREVAAPPAMTNPPAANQRMLDHLTVAKRVGIPSRMLRAAIRRGTLPGAVQHTRDLVMVPARYVNLMRIHGLLGVERMARNGQLRADS
jgi:hypothetical protein